MSESGVDLVTLAEDLKAHGIGAEDMGRYWSSSDDDPIELISAGEFKRDLIEAFYPTGGIEPGVNPPWAKTRDKVRFRPSELSIWNGINGHGKSQFLGQIILESLAQGKKACIASLELKPSILLSRLTRQAAALPNPTKEYIQEIRLWYFQRLWMINVTGSFPYQRLLEVFAYAHEQYGIDTFLIDSLMRCGIDEDDYNMQKRFIHDLCLFKDQYNSHIHLIVHPRKGANEKDIPGKLDISGTGAISNQADNCFTIWRNKAKEQEIQEVIWKGGLPSKDLLKKPDCIWMCDKQRNGSNWEGRIYLWFDQNSFQFLGSSDSKPKQYVDFSINNGE